jgi:hypothetical protein
MENELLNLGNLSQNFTCEWKAAHNMLVDDVFDSSASRGNRFE